MAESPRPPTGEKLPMIPGDAARSPDELAAAGGTGVLPERYSLREKDGVRFLGCDEAPRLRTVIDPAMSVSESEAVALGERTILLDGAGSFGPLIDNERLLYNLDHHAGCERLFTLSTCEQALLLVHSGLDLNEGDWTLYANDPDLDTVLAVWCLLNYRRVRELRPESRDVLIPLLRLEGAIDANGFELAQLCGLSTRVFGETHKRIEDLLSRERALKEAGGWADKDANAYTLEMLRAVDALVFSGEDFGDYTRIEEVYGHVELKDRCVAVVCRDPAGIYAVEQHLKDRWGEQLGILALENRPGQYTLRRLRSLAGPELAPAYELLNRIDPAVDGRPHGKRWGGSAEIGGSPRPGGTGLEPDEVLATLGQAYQVPTPGQRLLRVSSALLGGLSFFGVAAAGAMLPVLLPIVAVPALHRTAFGIALAAVIALGIGGLAIRSASGRRPWVLGWRQPALAWGWWLAPFPILAALPLAAWLVPIGEPASIAFVGGIVAVALAIPAIELWFRGWVHGLLVLQGPIQYPGREDATISTASLVSSTAYAACILNLAFWFPPNLQTLGALNLGSAYGLAVVGASAFGGGLVLAAIRERSLSLLPGIGLQALGAGAAAVLAHALA